MVRSIASVCEQTVYEQVFRQHAERLRNFLYYKCGDADQADDLLQESFVRLWNNCAKVPFEKAKSFLFTVGNNLFLKQVAHQKVRLKFQQQAPRSVNHESPDFHMEESEFKERLEAAISALPEGQREVFLLNRIEKMTYAEIAESLGVSVKAVEKRMHKALGKLRDLLQGH